jgi:hypothetical protein
MLFSTLFMQCILFGQILFADELLIHSQPMTLESKKVYLRQIQCSFDSVEGETQIFGQIGGIDLSSPVPTRLKSFWFAYSGKNQKKIEETTFICESLISHRNEMIEISVQGNQLIDLLK